MTPPRLTASNLKCAHGFFGREGGVSKGHYESLNCGPGSRDSLPDVAENRKRVAGAIGAEDIATAYQTHSAKAAYVDDFPQDAVEADALVTDRPGVAVAVLTADCTPVLFETPDGKLVAATHAGWRGSLGGILEATLDLLDEHGAERGTLRAAIGPCLRAPHFEVRRDLVDAVIGRHRDAERFFEEDKVGRRFVYDHCGFVQWRLQESGLSAENIFDVGGNSLEEPRRWFSYRDACRAGESDYGRNVSAICIPAS